MEALPPAPAPVEYPKPDAIVDVVLLTLHADRFSVFLARRDREPFRGSWALPGGYVHVDEDRDVEATALRVLRQKVGLVPPYLEQLRTFSGGERDGRGWTLSVCHFALVPEYAIAASPRVVSAFFPVDDLPCLPFDHGDMVAKAVGRARGKATYSSLPLFLLPPEFTLTDIRKTYAAVLGRDIPSTETKSFRRKITELGFVAPVSGRYRSDGGRPAQLYKAASDVLASDLRSGKFSRPDAVW